MKKATSMLTEVELEIMTLVWRLGAATVNDVLAGLPKSRPLAYTSVSTMLRILEQKKIVKTRKEGRGHLYVPVLTKEEFETRTLDHVVRTVFDGTPVALVRQLLGQVDGEELAEIKRLLKETK